MATVLHRSTVPRPRLVPHRVRTDLAVVVVTYNSRPHLKDCLQALQKACEGISTQVFVVDNGSSDGSADLVREHHPDIHLIANQENLGFSRANNQALKMCAGSSRYFLLLNPDTTFEPETLRTMIDFMDANPDAGMAGCKLVKPDGTLDWACKRSYITPEVLLYKALGLDRRHPEHRRFGSYQLTYLDADQIHEVDALVGAFMVVRAECIQHVGMLDESFFMYGEDLEWCYRAKEHGWKVFYVPLATAVHHKGHSSGKRTYRSIYHWYHCTWKAYHRALAPRYNWLVNALVWLGFHGMCTLSLLANVFRNEKRVPGRL